MLRTAVLSILALIAAAGPLQASGLLGRSGRAEILRKLEAGDPVALAWREHHLRLAYEHRRATPSARQWIRYGRADPNAPQIGIEEVQLDGGLVTSFAVAWWLNDDDAALRKAEEFLLAWTRAYVLDRHPSGDPEQINRNLHSLELQFLVQGFLTGYELVRDALAPETAAEIEAFYRRAFHASDAFMFAEELEDLPHLAPYGNHFTTHLENLARIAFVLEEPALVRRMSRRFQSQLDWHDLPAGKTPLEFWSSSPMGGLALRHFDNCPGRQEQTWPRTTSFDFVQRDSLGYHLIALLDLFHSAAIAAGNGHDLFERRGAAGQTLADGFAMLVPFVKEPQVPEFAESCIDRDAFFGGTGWIDQPQDTLRALACGALAYPERFGPALSSKVKRPWGLCPMVYLTWPEPNRE